MKNKNILFGLVLVLIGVIVFYYYYIRQYREQAPQPLAENLPVTQEEESVLERQVGVEIPEAIDKVKLSDVQGEESTGIATRKFEDGIFEHTIIASLPEPKPGEFYQGWLAKDQDLISTGKMEEKKGGWVLDYTGNEDQSDHNQVMVTLESKADDQPEKKVLEGSF
ncbi:MAG TPA: hypothetical protein VMW41_06560 [Candidatus Bathyarchaeia archaeon]|nr:hypothetical protein [Candidatus Bathyarchaeia archaeon]